MPAKYDPLGEYLLNLPADLNEVLLTFKHIEEIIEASLPSSARNYREWWSNEGKGTRHSQAKAWGDAGFMVSAVHPDGANPRVQFNRLRSR